MNDIVLSNLHLSDKKIEINNLNFSGILNDYIQKIIELITSKYNLNDERDSIFNLISEHLNNINIKFKKKKNHINQDERCQGRKMDGTQCSRRCKEGKDLCGSHLKNLTYGRINDDKIFPVKEKGKRGRKKKNVSDPNSNFIETWIDKDLGKSYLVDKNNLVYKNNPEYPELIGIKINKSIKIINEIPAVIFE